MLAAATPDFVNSSWFHFIEGVGVIIACIGSAAALSDSRIVRWFMERLVKAPLRETLGEVAEPIVERIVKVNAEETRVELKGYLDQQLQPIIHELSYNSGKSVKDTTKRTADDVAEIKEWLQGRTKNQMPHDAEADS